MTTTTALALRDRSLDGFAPRLPARKRIDSSRDPLARDFLSWANLIGVRLRDARAELGLSIFELAQKTGIFATTLRSYERGAMLPPLRSIYLVARALSVDPRELLP